MNDYKFTLPFPPSVNRYWRYYRGRVILSSLGRSYKKEVQSVVLCEKRPCTPLDGGLKMFIDIYPPDKRKRDIDNCCKAILDALEDCGIYKNDYQIDYLVIARKNVEKPLGKIIVTIIELTQENYVGRESKY